MKKVKKLLSLVLVLIMVLSLTACHKKDEVAITLGEHTITSAVYLTALISAEQEAKNIAYENASSNNVTLSSDEDYYKQKSRVKILLITLKIQRLSFVNNI